MSLPRFRRHSLSGRLVSLFVVMAILFVLVLGVTIGSAFRSHFQDVARPHLLRYLDYVRADIGVPPNLARAAEIAQELAVEIQIVGPDGPWSSSGRNVDVDTLKLHPEHVTNGIGYSIGEGEDREYLVARLPGYTYVFSIPRSSDRWQWRWMPLLVILLMLMLLYHATRWLFAPIAVIKSGVARIGQGDLDHRLEVNRRDELGELAQSINAMADDIRHMLEAKRQLLLAISHELRSPLTRAKVSAEMIENAGQRAGLRHDLNEMEHLIEELLETERLSTRHRVLNRAPVSLNSLVTEVIANFPAELVIEVDLPPEVLTAEMDAARLRLLLKNLLENALRHSGAAVQPPKIRLQRRGREVVFLVQDFGVGIDAKHLPHLAEPFYRVDPARRRETGGYGLGLYLCRVIAEAHGGKLTLRSELGKGTEVEVVLPLEPVPVRP